MNPTDTIGSRIAQVLVAEVGKALCLACIASRLGVSTFAVRNASMHARGLPGLTAVAAAPCDACHRRRLVLTAVAPRVSGQTGIVRCMVCARGIARPADVVIDIGGVRHRVCPTR